MKCLEGLWTAPIYTFTPLMDFFGLHLKPQSFGVLLGGCLNIQPVLVWEKEAGCPHNKGF